MVGPALVLIPALFQKYGYLPILSMLSVACLLSFFCGIMITHVITSIQSSPDQSIATKRPEMNHIIDYYFTTHTYLKRVTIIAYVASLVLTLMSNIIQSAQIVDLAIRDIFGCSYALELYPQFFHITCGKTHGDVTPFGTDIYVISMGFLILAWICLILYTVNYNLDDNIYLQWMANIGLLLLSAIWFGIFFNQDTFDGSRIGLIHENSTFNVDCVGIILFNFAFIVTIPSWYNEKAPSASVVKSLSYSIIFVAILFIVIGALAAMSFETDDLSNDNQSLFTVIDDFGGGIGKISVYLYPIIQNITSIPVFCIIIRYNLQNSGTSKYIANFISVLLPWLLAIPLFTGAGFVKLCDFTGIVLGSFVNFILPPYLYLLSVKMQNVDFFKHRKDGMMVLSNVDEDSELDSANDDRKNDGSNIEITPTKEAVVLDESEEDESKSEKMSLIELHGADDNLYTKGKNDDDDEDEIDMDIEKKNALRCTWDVVIAIICIVVASILSLVVIVEKLYVLITKPSSY